MHRRQRYVNLVGEPVQLPTEAVRICPSSIEPRICGALTFVGRADGGVPAEETVADAMVVAVAAPVVEVAVTMTLSEWPTSVAAGL